MTVLLVFFGLFFGGMSGSGFGILVGGIIGGVLGMVLRLRKELARLQKRHEALEARLARTLRKAEFPPSPPGLPKVGAETELGKDPEVQPGSLEVTDLDEAEPPQTPEAPGEGSSEDAISGIEATEKALPSQPDRHPAMPGTPSRGAHKSAGNSPGATSPIEAGLAKASQYVREFFTGGNTVVRVGLVVLLVGVVLLLKYAVDHALFPIELRMASAAGIGMLLVGFGYWQRKQRRDFGLSLQGGGIAAIYLVVFFSFRIYGLLPGGLAFGLLVAMALFSGIMAVTQNSLALIVIGVVGGFLAPVLASTGDGDHVVLFSYYLLLNLLIFGVAWFKVWRPLNLLGFVFTFGIGSTWGALSYKPEHFASTEPFLIAFFLLYVGIVVLFARRRQSSLRGWVDGSLTFGTPLAVLVLQYQMVHDKPFGMAYTSLGMAAVYIGVASLLWRKAPSAMRNLVEAFLALGIGFATLAVPYGFSNHSLTGATWAVEGLGLFWLGVRQSRWLSRAAGVLLQFAAGAAFLYSQIARGYPHDAAPVLNTAFAAAVLLVVSALGIAYLGHKHQERLSRLETGLRLFIAWALLWWYPVSAHEIFVHVKGETEAAALLVLVTITGLAFEIVGRNRRWMWGRVPALLSIPAVLVMMTLYRPDEARINPSLTGIDMGRAMEPALLENMLAGWGWLAWPCFIAGMFFTLWRFTRDHERWARGVHTCAFALVALWFAGLLAQQVRLLDGLGASWTQAATGAGFMLVFTVALAIQRRLTSPAWRAIYALPVLGTLIGLIGLWQVRTNLVAAGLPHPLPYIPLLNPLDISLALALLCCVAWVRTHWKPASFGLLVMGFLWINGMLARSVQHYTAIPWSSEALWESNAMQMAVAVSWTLMGLGTVLWATRHHDRNTWFIGCGVLGVVVAKLFLHDLEHQATVTKIVTFLVVGVLLLVVGYFSPMPPSDHASQSEEPENAHPHPEAPKPDQND